MSQRALQAVVAIFGVVALVFGLVGVLAGADGVRDGGMATASLDSELRFFAAWYAGAGVLLLRAARRVEVEGTTIRVSCAAVFIGACGRVVSLITVGRPGDLFVALMVVEFALAIVIVPWQSAVARHR